MRAKRHILLTLAFVQFRESKAFTTNNELKNNLKLNSCSNNPCTQSLYNVIFNPRIRTLRIRAPTWNIFKTRVSFESCQFKRQAKKKHESAKDSNKLLCTILSLIFIIFSPAAQIQAVHAESPTSWNSPEASALETSLLSTTSAADTTSKINNESEKKEAPSQKNMKYWDAINSNSPELVTAANERLLDYGVGTITTMYYDNTGGARFNVASMTDLWRAVRVCNKDSTTRSVSSKFSKADLERLPKDVFVDRKGAVKGLKFLVSTLNDPYSKFLTREELLDEYSTGSQNDGFLGLGMIVEPYSNPLQKTSSTSNIASEAKKSSKIHLNILGNDQIWSPSLLFAANINYGNKNILGKQGYVPPLPSDSNIIAVTRAENLPIVVAVKPNSPAERSGIVVGDRIAAVGLDKFVGLSQEEVSKVLNEKYNADNYAGYPALSIAKPVRNDIRLTIGSNWSDEELKNLEESIPSERIIGYRISRVRIPTSSLEPFAVFRPSSVRTDDESPSGSELDLMSTPVIAGGNSICYYELLRPNDSIFNSIQSSTDTASKKSPSSNNLVGYIRLTRFSRTSTAGYVEAVRELDTAGATSYIIDLRNNYGGIIQEAMLTASTLLHDPSTVLCYTLNSRGGFTPHDVEEYVVDTRYPGYLLSAEKSDVTLSRVRKTNPNIFRDGEWLPPSQFASLHEQGVKRGIKRVSSSDYNNEYLKTLKKQKRVVILINEGTASSAEVFASSLHDNGRTVALVGAKTYGKGLIQHTFPMPDGGGLRLTVAEYLTPALQHVTKVGGARYNAITGEMVGGGVQPDIYCESKGIPSNPGADICVGIALDALEDATVKDDKTGIDRDVEKLERMGGTQGGYGKRRSMKAGIAKDDF